ncbi:uncharacterized protein [Alexandromys fortis]|uniref:uncharacterized protein n=1 Tax=Alexandromys fortis TaxID=100897 RepID=UPI00215359AF|nr:uncharacterized protein LOC126488689 [Microtus fortis]
MTSQLGQRRGSPFNSTVHSRCPAGCVQPALEDFKHWRGWRNCSWCYETFPESPPGNSPFPKGEVTSRILFCSMGEGRLIKNLQFPDYINLSTLKWEKEIKNLPGFRTSPNASLPNAHCWGSAPRSGPASPRWELEAPKPYCDRRRCLKTKEAPREVGPGPQPPPLYPPTCCLPPLRPPQPTPALCVRMSRGASLGSSQDETL